MGRVASGRTGGWLLQLRVSASASASSPHQESDREVQLLPLPPLLWRTPRDKCVIEHWLRLYNRLTGFSYRVTAWPDSDSSQKNVDALCTDDSGRELALEHTLIEPFQNEKSDAARFLQTLAALDNDPASVPTRVHLHRESESGEQFLRVCVGLMYLMPFGKT